MESGSGRVEVGIRVFLKAVSALFSCRVAGRGGILWLSVVGCVSLGFEIDK